MEALEKGKIYTAEIEGYSSEGLGIARVNGAVVFVPDAVRGETADLRITRDAPMPVGAAAAPISI